MNELRQSCPDSLLSKLRKHAPVDVATLPVVETFHSIQGEGYWAGCSAFFIRLAGCDVGCKWCDQKESWSDRYPRYNAEALTLEARSHYPYFVVITGGEPLMHNLDELCDRLDKAYLKVHLETSGTHPFSGNFDWVTLSPKRHREPLAIAFKVANELKIVVQNEEDLRFAEEIESKAGDVVKLLQPEWGTPSAKQLVFDYVLKNPQWRISLQTHKFLGVR